MDVGELLSFKPEHTPKRAHGDDDDYCPTPDRSSNATKRENERAKRMRRIAQAKESADFIKEQPALDSMTKILPSFDDMELTEQERLNILKYVENEEPEGEAMDEASLKKLLLVFEKRNLKNQEMRMKFSDNPEKFMDSEVELHSVIQELKAIATVPDLYPVLVELHGIPSLLELLSHPNTDIAVAIVDMLQEITDVDILGESSEGAEILIEALRKQQVVALLVQNLERLNEQIKEEADGVHNSLAVIENLTEISSDIVREAAEQGLLAWILKRLKQKTFDPNKLYCSEILSILIQTENENRLLLGNIDGIDVLLQQLAIYKRHDPASSDEREYMENLFNSVCSALMAKENRERFLKGEGLQLMNLMLREKKLSRNGSLKVLDYAMSGPDGRDNCNKFVDILGLRTIFPLFMKTPKRSKKRLFSTDEHEEHVCSVIASMLRNCKGTQRQRLLSKFTENDYEKVDRLLELHLKYLSKVETIDREIAQQKNSQLAEYEDDEAENNYIKRLTGGLFTLQMIDYIIIEISTTSEVVKQRILQILNLRSASIKAIKNIMREYVGNLGDDGDRDWKQQERAHILSLIDRF